MPPRTVRSTITKVKSLTSDNKPKREWGTTYDSSHGFVIPIKNVADVPVFIDRRLMRATAKDRKLFLNRPKTIGHLLTCSGKAWDIETEPLGLNKFGIIVYTAKEGKAIMTGTGAVRPDGTITFQARTLYEGITNPGGKHTIEVGGEVGGSEGGGSSGGGSHTYSVTVKVIYVF